MHALESIDFANPANFLLTTCYASLAIFGRYLLLCLGFSFVFERSTWQHRKIAQRPQARAQKWKEIGWSALSSVLFAIVGTALLLAWQLGYTQIYTGWDAYSWVYIPISALLFLFFHETYYYWLHRWMHRPKIYRWIHKAHHDSFCPSVWTSFSFHPIESLLQSVVLPIAVFVMPMHYSVLIVLLVIMTVSSVINHLNIEIFPASFAENRFGKWLVGATHHALHHTQFRFNYGLYFTFWDKWMQTESPQFEKVFREKTIEPKKKIPRMPIR